MNKLDRIYVINLLQDLLADTEEDRANAMDEEPHTRKINRIKQAIRCMEG